MASTSNIKNPSALINTLAQQHPLATVETMRANKWTPEAINAFSDDVKRDVCGAIQDAVEARWGHRSVTTLAVAKSQVEAYGMALVDMTDADGATIAVPMAASILWLKISVWRPLTFEANREGTRKGNRKPLAEQQRDWVDAIRRAARALETTPETPETTPEPMPAPPVEPKAPSAGVKVYDQLDTILAAMRKFCASRDIEGNFVQSARSDFNGYRMLGQGIPPEAVATAIATTWSKDTKRNFTAQTGIKLDYDPCTFGEAIEGLHRVTPYLIAVIKANVPVWMHGATGTLKSSGIKRAAAEMGLPYYETNLAGQLASAITGRDLLKRFSESVYVKAYRDGGIMALEEIDKAHPLVLTQINNSIESDEYFNPMMEEPIKRHDDFRLVASANTPGTGPTKEFNASVKVDDSTMDRVRAGYIAVNRDNAVVRSILDGIRAAQLAA